jgi:hypothetical protein
LLRCASAINSSNFCEPNACHQSALGHTAAALSSGVSRHCAAEGMSGRLYAGPTLQEASIKSAHAHAILAEWLFITATLNSPRLNRRGRIVKIS